MFDNAEAEVIKVKKNSYFFHPKIENFSFGEIVKSDLNQDGVFNDVCVIIGIRYDQDDNLWIYRIRLIISFVDWDGSGTPSYEPNDEAEVSGMFLKYLTVEDLERFTNACNNYLTSMESLI